MKNKNISLIVLILFLGLLTVGGTYAFYSFSLTSQLGITNGGTYVDNTECFDIEYEAGTDLKGKLFPSSTPSGGLSGKVKVGIKDNCKVSGKLTLNLNINSGSDSSGILTQPVVAHCENQTTLETLSDYNTSDTCTTSGGRWITEDDSTALKYAVYKSSTENDDGTIVSVGYINQTSGTQKIYYNIVESGVYFYTIKIWLDGNLSDNTYENQNFSANISSSIEQAETGTPNPELDQGMIPVTIANNGTVTTTTKSNSNWYNYNEKQWANAVIVKESGTKTRGYYLNNPGVTVNQSDILGYYVWVPRYKYKLNGKKCSTISNPTQSTYPDCYGAPYSISETDESSLITWWQTYKCSSGYCEGTLTTEESTTDINTLLKNGYIQFEDENILSFLELISIYNEETSSSITYTGTFNGGNEASGPNTIEITFESKSTPVTIGDAKTTYHTHPAFIWDGATIGGFWVGKFETTGDETTPTVLPNTSSLRSQNISTQFQTSLKFAGGTLNDGTVTFTGSNTYGIGSSTDTHMMKNSEWGAVAYLSHSIYGINSEIRINNTYYTTGCGASTKNGASATECQIAYGSGVTSYPQSSTGNITGIFDMVGGAFESVMGVLSDSNGNPMSGYDTSLNSGFNGLLYDNTSYTSGIDFPNVKYYDLYLQSQFSGDATTNLGLCTLETCGGHAIDETLSWYEDYERFVHPERPWFERSGYHGSGAEAGLFGASYGHGGEYASSSWRSVFVVNGE